MLVLQLFYETLGCYVVYRGFEEPICLELSSFGKPPPVLNSLCLCLPLVFQNVK